MYVAFLCAPSLSEVYQKPKNQKKISGKMIQQYIITQVHAKRN